MTEWQIKIQPRGKWWGNGTEWRITTVQLISHSALFCRARGYEISLPLRYFQNSSKNACRIDPGWSRADQFPCPKADSKTLGIFDPCMGKLCRLGNRANEEVTTTKILTIYKLFIPSEIATGNRCYFAGRHTNRQWRHELLSQMPENFMHQNSKSVLTTWESLYQVNVQASSFYFYVFQRYTAF